MEVAMVRAVLIGIKVRTDTTKLTDMVIACFMAEI